MDAETIARIIGHSDGGALIHGVYGHVTPAMLDRAVVGDGSTFRRLIRVRIRVETAAKPGMYAAMADFTPKIRCPRGDSNTRHAV